MREASNHRPASARAHPAPSARRRSGSRPPLQRLEERTGLKPSSPSLRKGGPQPRPAAYAVAVTSNLPVPSTVRALGLALKRCWSSLDEATRPVDPELVRALSRRWQELPEAARTPAQLLGRRTTGCEGTHGVFPRCDLACTPCYHSVRPTGYAWTGRTPSKRSTGRWHCLRRCAGPGARPAHRRRGDAPGAGRSCGRAGCDAPVRS